MKFYHATNADALKAILKDGFRDNQGTYMTGILLKGVWVSDRPVDSNEGAKGTDTVCMEIPEEKMVEYEVIEEGRPPEVYREFLVPADILNQYKIEVVDLNEYYSQSHRDHGT